MLHGLTNLAEEDGLNTHNRIQSGAGETHHQHVHDRPGESRIETELLQKHITRRQSSSSLSRCPCPRGTDQNDDQCREHGLAHHPGRADDPRVTHLVGLLRCDAGADKAFEATRGTAHNTREHQGKDEASIIDGLTVGVAIADGARAQLGSSDEDSKRQSHHDGLWLMAVDVVAGPQQQPD